MAAIPELKAFCAGVQEDTEAIVAQHSDIQFVFDHYMQVGVGCVKTRLSKQNRS
jgi:hypothetical protein